MFNKWVYDYVSGNKSNLKKETLIWIKYFWKYSYGYITHAKFDKLQKFPDELTL